MLTVGLTGGIASGKSEVGAELRRQGCRLFDADIIARRLMAPGGEVHRAVVRAFGRGILDRDGAIHRPALGDLVFGDPGKRKALETIVHPAVVAEERRLLDEAEQQAAGAPCIAVVEAALMVEAGTWQRYHRLVVVHCGEAQQVERLALRGLDREAALSRIRAQFPLERKLALAHYTVDSSGILEQTRKRAVELHRNLVRDERQLREGQ